MCKLRIGTGSGSSEFLVVTIYMVVLAAYRGDSASLHPKVVGCRRIDILKVNIKAPVTAEYTVSAQVRELFYRVIGCPDVFRIVEQELSAPTFDIADPVAPHMEFRPQRNHNGLNPSEFFIDVDMLPFG